MRYESKSRDLKKFDYSNRAACLVCAMRSRRAKEYRKASRLESEAVPDRMAERLTARPEILDTRREVVEHPIGGVKQWMNQGAFLMRGLDKARAEFSLTALVYNMRRAINILGVEEFWRGGIDEGRAGLREPVCPPMGAEMALQLGSVEFCTSGGMSAYLERLTGSVGGVLAVKIRDH